MPLNRSKPLYQPWSEEEFVADQFVRAMKSMERWMFRTLLQQAFFCSTRPYLPDDEDQLWMLAGCDYREQWDENKTRVLKMFSKIQRRGVHLLKQKRVELDFRRERKHRQKLASNGHKGGKATQAKLKQGSSTELNRTEPNKTEPDSTERNNKRECVSSTPRSRIAPDDDNCRKEVTLQTSQDTARVIHEISSISHLTVIPDAKQAHAICKWLADYTPEEILDAFRRFYGEITDDFQLKFAAKNFVEKGPYLIEGMRKIRQQRAAEEELRARQRQQLEAQAQKEFEEMERRKREEEELIETTLPQD